MMLCTLKTADLINQIILLADYKVYNISKLLVYFILRTIICFNKEKLFK